MQIHLELFWNICLAWDIWTLRFINCKYCQQANFWLSKSDQQTINVAALDTECQRPLVTGWKLPSLSSSNKTLNPKKIASFPFDGQKSYPFHMRQSFSGRLLLLSNLRLDRVCHAVPDWPAQVGDVVRWLVDCWLIALDWLVFSWWNCGLLV